MSNSMDIRNLLPKSMEVNRVEQLRHVAEQHQQQHLAVKQLKEHDQLQKQVNQSLKSEGERINKDQESSAKNQAHEQRKKPKNEEKDKVDEKTHAEDGRGFIIDFRV